jgi:dTDP-4-amino-4,6-dideoxygalactose transaminase
MKPPKITVPLLDLKPQYHALKAELDEAMLKVAASQMFILGPAVRELEEKLAAYSGAKYGLDGARHRRRR